MQTKILFIRHGHSEANKIGFWGGQIDVPLTSLGVEQAEKMAAYLLENYKVDEIYSSHLQRATRTASAIAEKTGLLIHTDKRLGEIMGGDWEGLLFTEIRDKYPKEFELWQNDMSKVFPPNGESLKDVQNRAYEAVKEICEKNEGKTIVIVGHRVMLRSLQCVWNNLSIEEVNKCEWINNCSVSEVLYEEGRLIPVKINQNEFMGENATQVNTIM